MAKRKHSELAAGIFVLIALGAGVAVLIWLGAADVFTQRGQTVVFVARQDRGSLGLEVGSAVKLNDADIGKIDKIEPDPAGKRTLYYARLNRKDIRVHKDARANAVAEFIGGASVVLEDFGSQDAPPADANNPVPIGVGISALLQQAQDVLGYGDKQRLQFQSSLKNVALAAAKVRDIADAIANEVNEENKTAMLGRVKEVVEDLKGSSANLLVMTTRLKAETDQRNPASLIIKVHAIADNTKSITGNASGMMKTIRPDIEKTIAKVRLYTEKDIAALLADLRKSNTTLVEIVADFKAISTSARGIVVLNRDNIDATIANMKSVSLNLNAAAKEIRRNPWRLLAKPDDKQVHSQNMYDAARAFAEGAEQLDDAVVRLGALRKDRAGKIRKDNPELIKIQEHLKTTFEKLRKVEDKLWNMAK